MDKNKEQVLAQLLELFKTEWPTETAQLNLQPGLPIFYEGIGLDSVDGATLLLALEEVFRIEIEKESLAQDHFATIDTLATHIVQLLQQS
jgi:acyl carrier protein